MMDFNTGLAVGVAVGRNSSQTTAQMINTVVFDMSEVVLFPVDQTFIMVDDVILVPTI